MHSDRSRRAQGGRAYPCPMTRPLTNWHSSHAEQLTRGERAADRLRNGRGHGSSSAVSCWSAKRQDAIAAALAQHDYETNRAAKREIEELMAINRMQLDLLHELRRDLPSPGAIGRTEESTVD